MLSLIIPKSWTHTSKPLQAFSLIPNFVLSKSGKPFKLNDCESSNSNEIYKEMTNEPLHIKEVEAKLNGYVLDKDIKYTRIKHTNKYPKTNE